MSSTGDDQSSVSSHSDGSTPDVSLSSSASGGDGTAGPAIARESNPPGEEGARSTSRRQNPSYVQPSAMAKATGLFDEDEMSLEDSSKGESSTEENADLAKKSGTPSPGTSDDGSQHTLDSAEHGAVPVDPAINKAFPTGERREHTGNKV